MNYFATFTDLVRKPYLEGECHVLALALQREYGWRLGAVLEQGEDEFVAHVFALDAEDRAIDACGQRPYEQMKEEWDSYSTEIASFEEVTAVDIAYWIKSNQLFEYTEEDLAEALEFAKTYLQLEDVAVAVSLIE
jgi:hypothetical protein